MATRAEEAFQIQVDEMEWMTREALTGDAPKATGAVLKLLRDETGDGGPLVKILRIPPGWNDTTLHWHTYEEEMFLLEGEMTFFEQHWHAPAYFLVPPRTPHGHVVSKEGATILQRFGGPIDMNYVDSYDALDAD